VAVERKAEVIVAYGVPATNLAKKATKAIPIVALTGSDPVGLGLVRNLGRPEGNVTGISFASALLVEKRLELLKEVVPGLRRLGVLLDPGAGSRAVAEEGLSRAAARMGIAVHFVTIADPAATHETAAALAAAKPDALFTLPSNRFLEYRNEIVQVATVMRLPAMYSATTFVRAGGMLAYSADMNAVFRRSAHFVDRLLKGSKPAELPFEQAAKFNLAVNLRTARTIGFSIPQGVLVRADEVIQ
jgi:putative ABC transport system substrate-binding protein